MARPFADELHVVRPMAGDKAIDLIYPGSINLTYLVTDIALEIGCAIAV